MEDQTCAAVMFFSMQTDRLRRRDFPVGIQQSSEDETSFRKKGQRAVGYCLSLCTGLDIWFQRRRARVVMERSAKPFTPVQFRASPPRKSKA
jgi:hypothetical protein